MTENPNDPKNNPASEGDNPQQPVTPPNPEAPAEPQATPAPDAAQGGWPAPPAGNPQQGPYDQAPYAQAPGASPYGQVPQPQKASGITITAMVLGIVAICMSLIPFVHYAAFAVGAAAVIVAIIALVKKRHRKGFALTGLITGVLSLIIAVVWSIVVVAAVGFLGEAVGETGNYTFEATSVEPAEVALVTTVDDMTTGMQTLSGGETLSEQVEANTLIGSVTITNASGSTGEIACRILDEAGSVVSEHSASGSGAEAVCSVAESMMQ
ncbi:hypothetical protein [Zhihengliuella halotolerans]|uniref:DUF4190 domain-containing protein n=1 Tax=Zhihengliuella halotolerans TaxID=370736 RepID=A0A4Q8A9N5_9MICC|nr:hypothetical protein [Zhihengliuella halotolerans]RZU60654.1 hypothetical protein EV380_0198 [Zhihengliuella halotolerans]